MKITVIKQDFAGKETWRYEGRLLGHVINGVVIEAFFNRPDLPFHGIVLGEGDRFVEGYYTGRWYNIFEIHDRIDDHLKGWYCNVSYPAVIDRNVIAYKDLALDLLVFPDGRQLVLDEDEFLQLPLSDPDCVKARLALKDLQALFAEQEKFQF
jgi:uncharacterized protein